MYKVLFLRLTIIALVWIPLSCKEKPQVFSKALISEMNLKRGDVISCGSPDPQYGSVDFEITCNDNIKPDFNLAVKLLHSFEYDEAEKVFARIIDGQPDCAMAYWGVAMSNFHPLWTPPLEDELKKGSKALELAAMISGKTKREQEYIDAIGSFYKDWKTVDHRTRTKNFESAMQELYSKYPDDKETAIFYALAMTAAADPADKTFAKQKKAGDILNALYEKNANHPGIVHYIIHTYDSPELADQALQAARKYASVAPSSSHALHMPSHIFTRLGLWDEGIQSNLASMSSAQCYADSAGIKGHWDEEIHALDYLVYSYLQKGDNELAKKYVDYLGTIKEVYPVNFKVAYSFAAIPARYALENKLWKDAANVKIHYENFPWQNQEWQKAILHFARSLGASNTGDLASAKKEAKELSNIHNLLVEKKDNYKAIQVKIQLSSAEAWIAFREGKNEEALKLIQEASEMEDKTEKHPVTPGEVVRARQLWGDMLMQMNQPAKALEIYESELKKHPNRFNILYGAGLAAEKSGNTDKAKGYYQQLVSFVPVNSNRAEYNAAKKFLKM